MNKLLLFMFVFAPLVAAQPEPFFPGVSYDTTTPTMKSVNGYGFGEKIAMSYEIMAYSKALADASPKVSLQLRGKTWEDRPMGLLFVTSEKNQGLLAKYRDQYQAIADPRKTNKSQFESIQSELPVLVWLQQSVHGNEISGSDSGLALAWHLAAATNSTEVDTLLDQSILVVELMQNPDGRDRFVTYSRHHRSPGGNPDSQAAERMEHWASGRFNHYNFDMNRDWFAMTQLETRAKVASILEWHPHVTVDLHEMGSESSFFAAKPAIPANPILPQSMLNKYEDLGRAIASTFDARGLEYFHSEVFDSFYPGYGEAWPSLHGTVGVLFEQGSARGLQYRRRDGSILTHRDAVLNQTLGSYAVLKYAADNRADMLAFFYNTRKQAMETEEKQVILLPGSDPIRTLRLGRLLQEQGIEVEQITEDIRGLNARNSLRGEAKKHEVPAGSILVRFDQPAGLLARTLLFDHISMDEAFIARQKERMKNREFLEIYDVTGWSLPMLHGVEALYPTGAGYKGSGSSELSMERVIQAEATLAWLVPTGVQIGPLLADLLQQGVKVHYTNRDISHEGHEFARGSLVIKRKGNPENIQDILASAAEKHEVSYVGASTGWFSSGPALGSDYISYIEPPRIGLLWDQPTNPMSAGWVRYLVEQRFGYQLTALKSQRLGNFDLDRYNVIIMPEGWGWDRVIGQGGADNLKSWIRRGGVLISIASSTDWLMGKSAGLIDTAREYRGGIVEEKPDTAPPKTPEDDPLEMIIPRREMPQSVSGALLRVEFDSKHWLAYGMKPEQAVMVNSNRILRPLRLNQGDNPGRFAESERLLMSGFISDETLEQFAHKPFVMTKSHGRGMVIAFTEDPNYRAFMDGLNPLMANAIFFGPSRTR